MKSFSVGVPSAADARLATQCLQRREHAVCGFTLTELMVALALGMVITVAIFGGFLANRQMLRQTDNLSQIQDDARLAFELLARDLRAAGGIACGSRAPLDNRLNTVPWWARWQEGPLRGYGGTQAGPQAFGSGSGQRVSGTDAVMALSGTVREARLMRTPNIVQEAGLRFSHPNVFIACDPVNAVLFQTNSAGNVLNSTVPLPNIAAGGLVALYDAAFWYVGHNPRGGRSLYRLTLQSNGIPAPYEVVPGVTNLHLRYATQDASGATADLCEASAVAQWVDVVGIRVELTLETSEAITVNQQNAGRTFYHYISLRNREEVL